MQIGGLGTGLFNSPFKSGFTRALRLDSDLPTPANRFVRKPKIDEDDAVRNLIGSRGVFKLNGKGEELAFNQIEQKRESDTPSVLGKALGKLSSIAKDIKSLKRDLADGAYQTETESNAAKAEIDDLENEYTKVIESRSFKRALSTVSGLRSDLTALNDKELYGDADTPIVSAAVNDLAKANDASKLSRLAGTLQKIADSAPGSLSEEAIDRLIKNIDDGRAIESGGDPKVLKQSSLELLFKEARGITRKLSFIKEAKEKEDLNEEALRSLNEQEKNLQDQFKEVKEGRAFKKIENSLDSVLEKYRFNEQEDLKSAFKSLSDLSDDELSSLTVDELNNLSQKLSKASDIESGATLSEDQNAKVRKKIDLHESQFEKYQRKYKNELVDEIEDFLYYTAKDANGTYALNITRSSSGSGKLLSIFA